MARISRKDDRMADLGPTRSVKEIGALLSDWDAKCRHEARDELVRQGEAALPVLLEKLSHNDWHVRWEAVKALGEIGTKEVVEPLIKMLEDDDTGVRWAAMRGLIHRKREAVRPVMVALTRGFDSARFREGAHHVLHALHDQGLLLPQEDEVFRALEGITPGIRVAEAANRVLIMEFTRPTKVL
jgi:HEAT repeat protein